MADRAVPALPSRDLAATRAFYGRWGFTCTYDADGWLILQRGPLHLEFFAHPDLDPATSHFQCCLRVADLDGLWSEIRAAGVPVADRGFPRLHPPRVESWGGRVGFLVDPDGTQVNLIARPASEDPPEASATDPVTDQSRR